MKLAIEDFHNGHGTVFTIALKISNEKDAKAIKTLASLLRPFILGETAGGSALYIIGIEISSDGKECKLKFAESMKVLAQVDHRWNPRRADEKFVVLVLESEGSDQEYLSKKGETK